MTRFFSWPTRFFSEDPVFSKDHFEGQTIVLNTILLHLVKTDTILGTGSGNDSFDRILPMTRKVCLAGCK